MNGPFLSVYGRQKANRIANRNEKTKTGYFFEKHPFT